MNVWAKSRPPQSLRDHLTAVRDNASLLLTPARRRAFERVGIGAEEAQDLLLSAAWLHDFGKAEQKWQDDIKAAKDRLPQHALSSFWACCWAMGAAPDKLPASRLALALAVLAHHGQMHAGSFSRDRFRHQIITPLGDVWLELARDVPMSLPAPKAAPPTLGADKVCTFVEMAKARVPTLASSTKFRGLFCLLLSLLVEADHSASGSYTPSTQTVTNPRLGGPATVFQNGTRVHPAGSLCAMAGCGAGKTAAALLRASEMAESFGVDRIVLCLPTRFTSNSLLRDMTNAFKYAYAPGDVGLVHSEALQVLQAVLSRDDDEEDFPPPVETPEERAARSIRYEHPITISTVDHLLMSLYHGYKYSDRAFGNLLSSLVVFDEIHAYDATTLNAIREGKAVLDAYGIPSLFMSATLPSTRRAFFGFSEQATIIEGDNPFRPFRTEPLPEPLTSGRGAKLEVGVAARAALRESKGLKLAVYVNQIERAKALARAAREELPGATLFCYHSELAPQDRRALEDKIIEAFKRDEPVVLIATQAAELSLDISAERMITELAPADVLVQRAGRLHRRGDKPVLQAATSRLEPGFVFRLQIAPLDLTPAEKKPELTPGALPYEDVELLKRTNEHAPWNQDFDFQTGINWCERSLIDIPPHKSIGLRDASLKDTAFGRKPQENFNGEDNPNGVAIRDIDEQPVLVIPQCYYDEGLPKDRLALAQKQVPLRRSRFGMLKSADALTFTQTEIILKRGTARQEVISLPIIVVHDGITYDAEGGGFDLSELSDPNTHI